MSAPDSERPGPNQIPASDPMPDGTAAEPAPNATPAVSDDAPSEAARSPDEYLETPGSHRRDDGAATDVGA